MPRYSPVQIYERYVFQIALLQTWDQIVPPAQRDPEQNDYVDKLRIRVQSMVDHAPRKAPKPQLHE